MDLKLDENGFIQCRGAIVFLGQETLKMDNWKILTCGPGRAQSGPSCLQEMNMLLLLDWKCSIDRW